MTISGNQKHSLQNQIRSQLIQLLREFGIEKTVVDPFDVDALELSDMDRDFNDHMSQSVTKFTNRVLDVMFNNPENHGPLGQIRGYIRQVREPLSHIHNGQRVPSAGQSVGYQALQDILAGTKLLMNGNNPLNPPVCQYKQEDEKYYCLKIVGWGNKFCEEHWKLVEEETS